jgi:RNA polymerase-interacting CarD/CdnL/TRCF family regulator
VQDKFKEHEWRIGLMEGKLKDYDLKNIQQENQLNQISNVIKEQDQRQFQSENRLNSLDEKINSKELN